MDSQALELVSEPAAEPVNLIEAKQHIRVDADVTDDDGLIASYVAAVREDVEEHIGRGLVTQTWRLWLEDWPEEREIRIPWPPLQKVDSVTYIDEDGVTQTMSSSDYIVDTVSEPGRIVLTDDADWPSATLRAGPAIAVQFVSGYATPFTAAPSTNVLTLQGRAYTAGDAVQVWNSGGALPGGLAERTTYYVRDVSGSTLKLASSSGGTAIDLTDAGTGTHFIGRRMPRAILQAMRLLLGHWYENREAVVDARRDRVVSMPFAVESLLLKKKIWSF